MSLVTNSQRRQSKRQKINDNQQLITKYYSSPEPQKTTIHNKKTGEIKNTNKENQQSEKRRTRKRKASVENKTSPLKVWLKTVDYKMEDETVNRNHTSNSHNVNVCKMSKLDYLLKCVEENDRHTEKVNRLIEKINQFKFLSSEYLELSCESSEDEISSLHCKDLTKSDVKAAFKSNIRYMEGIMSGKIQSVRHDKFKRRVPDYFNEESLIYNVSMHAFRREHIRFFARRMDRKFGNDKNEYYFKVLIPELCLKIFMDKYHMEYDEAYKYLEGANFADGDT